jgi:two-component system NarL family sensor kinase
LNLEPIKLKKIFTRLFLSYLAIALASAVIISVIFYFIMRDALIERAYDQLSSINILKKEQIDSYFTQSRRTIEFLFTHDVFLNRFPDGEANLNAATLPQEVKAEIASIRDLYEFRNIALLDAKLNPIYALSPTALDYGSALATFKPGGEGKSYVIDASPIAHAGTTLLYIVPVDALPGATVYIVIEESFQKIQDLLDENTGMGKTGETYVVGSDMKLRSSSRFLPGTQPSEITAYDFRSDASHIRPDYRNIMVVSVDRPLNAHNLDWSVLSEIDLAEAMGPINELRNFLVITVLALILITMAVTAVVSNAITKPILRLRDVIIALSKGIVPSHNINMKREDEIGEIAAAVDQLINGLRRTTQFAYSIGEGKFETPFTTLSNQDTLGQALIHMRDQLRNLREKEIRLVREKAGAVLEGQENERKRITRELHDGVGQLLTVIKLRLMNVEGNNAIVNDIKSLLKETVDEVKRISFNVMPNTLVDFGLEAALNTLCTQVRKAGGVSIDFQYIREVDRALSFDISTAVYRIAQEGLNNILKHAEATKVNLYVIDKEDEVFMLLDDNGKGFSPEVRATVHTGFGLKSMQERARLLNGSVDVHSEWGAGTTVEVHIPVAVGELVYRI